MRRPLYVRTTGKRAGRPIVPRVRVTRPVRKLNAAERAEVEQRLRREDKI
jgi:hypothetical protein